MADENLAGLAAALSNYSGPQQPQPQPQSLAPLLTPDQERYMRMLQGQGPPPAFPPSGMGSMPPLVPVGAVRG